MYACIYLCIIYACSWPRTIWLDLECSVSAPYQKHLICQYLQIQIVAMHRNEWVENADRWVAGFLEMFEEGCHKMVSETNYLSI